MYATGVFYQNSKPTNACFGDLWFDTNYGTSIFFEDGWKLINNNVAEENNNVLTFPTNCKNCGSALHKCTCDYCGSINR